MLVVIDTNILFNAFFESSSNFWIWEALRKGELVIAVTTDILDEYEEILERHYGSLFAQATLDALTTLDNIRYITKYYFWFAIPQDPDDEKFYDCAVAANAQFLVTNDRHFNHLKKDEHFPFVNIITSKEFHSIFFAE